MTDIFGYNGKIVYINLSNSKIEIKDLEPIIAEEYLGGVGLSAKITHDMLSIEDYETLKQNPLSSINPLILATGPLTGTITPSSSRYSVSGISPLTGIWGESSSGGFFPMALKKCGFDALVITGEAKDPVYLDLNNGNIEIKDATKLWGKDTRETISLVRKDLNNDKVRVACIGKGGENLVKYAAILNDEGRAAGRCGFGTLMGKRKLKAIAVKGGAKIDISDIESFKKFGKNARTAVEASFTKSFFGHYGTACYTDIGMVFGDVPTHYYTNTEFHAEKLSGMALKQKYPVLQYACAGCPIGCGRTTIVEMDGKEIEVDGPEYETIATFGPMCGIFDFDPIIKNNHRCNLDGIDTISSGVSISFLIYLVENKIGIEEVSKYIGDIDITEIKWGNAQITFKLLEKIIKREGIGDILADGVRVMAEKFKVDPELAAHVKGLEVPMHDPRAYVGQALTYMTCCVGANHNKGDFFVIQNELASYTKVRKGDRFQLDGRENEVKILQDIASIYDSAVICNFTHISEANMSRLLKAVTGFSSLGNKKKMLMVGERANNLKRLINCKLGITREDDKLPGIVSKALKSGGSAGISLENMEDNLMEYYKLRGWDWETGRPTIEKLKELKISLT